MSYKAYPFRGKDPVIALLKDAIDVSGLSLQQVSDISGVNYRTMWGWFTGTVRAPRFCGVQAVAIAMHHEFRLMATREPRIVKLRRAA